MCKCCVRFQTCLSVTLNLIFFILGIALLSGGIYAKTQIDVEKLMGQQYKNSVPPIEKFVPGNQNGSKELGKLQKKADDFVKKSINEVGAIVQTLVTLVMVIGIFTAAVALLGIIALTCCKKRSCCATIYMVVLIIAIIPFIVLIVYVADDAILRGMIFEQLDGLAFKKDFVNRFFMAAVQDAFQCCAVRSSVEYFCRDLYDYACNSGCMTMEPIWETMKSKMPIPVCKKEANLVDACKRFVKVSLMAGKFPMKGGIPSREGIPNKANVKRNAHIKVDRRSRSLPASKLKPGAKKEDCDNKLNVPSPIKKSGQDMCKWKTKDWDKQLYDKNFLEENSKKVREVFEKSDPASHNDPNSNFQIFGSPLKEGNIPARQGCGYAIWTKIPHLNQYLNYALIFCVIILLLLLFQFFTALLVCLWNKKEQKKGSKSKRESSSKSSSKSSSPTKSSK